MCPYKYPHKSRAQITMDHQVDRTVILVMFSASDGARKSPQQDLKLERTSPEYGLLQEGLKLKYNF